MESSAQSSNLLFCSLSQAEQEEHGAEFLITSPSKERPLYIPP